MTRPYKKLFLICSVYCIVLTYIVVANRMLIISNKEKIENIVIPKVDSNSGRSKKSEKILDSIIDVIDSKLNAD